MKKIAILASLPLLLGLTSSSVHAVSPRSSGRLARMAIFFILFSCSFLVYIIVQNIFQRLFRRRKLLSAAALDRTPELEGTFQRVGVGIHGDPGGDLALFVQTERFTELVDG